MPETATALRPVEASAAPLFYTADVLAISGLTFRTVDYWCRRGVITPAVPGRGSGYQRRFSPDQAAGLQVVAHLLDIAGPRRGDGVCFDVVRRVTEWFEDHPGVRTGLLFVPAHGEPALLDTTIPALDLDVRLLTAPAAWLVNLAAVIAPATDDRPMEDDHGHRYS